MLLKLLVGNLSLIGFSLFGVHLLHEVDLLSHAGGNYDLVVLPKLEESFASQLSDAL